MITATVLPALNPSAIQEEAYQAVYDIWGLQNATDNHHLAASLCLPGEDHVQVVKFGATLNDGPDILEVAVTMLRNVGKEGRWRLHWKEEWEFEGILWHCQLHARKDRAKTIDAKVRGTYSSRTGKGKLYVLAHEQPKPLVESISWEELIKRFSQNAAHIIDFKFRRNGAVVRTKVNGMSICENLLKVKRLEIYCPLGYDKTKVGGGAHYFDLTDECTPPVVLADGRVIFSGGGIDYTIYQPNTGAYCS